MLRAVALVMQQSIMSRSWRKSLVVYAFLLSGCGTFADAMCGPVTDHVYYRGVRFDALAVSEGGPQVLMAADMPISAVADTLLVPYLAYHQMTDPARARPALVADEKVSEEPPPVGGQPSASPK
jgi:uncharacterized protein YceK